MNDNPTFQNEEYILMSHDVKICRDLHSGQRALRNDTYLPKFEGESSKGYETRKGLSYLNNKFNDKISTSVGLILGKEIVVNEDIPYIKNDIDGQGSTVDQFALNTLKNGQIDGHAFILVDAPSTTASSLKEQEDLNIHPYWVNIPMSNVLNWDSENGVLTQCTIIETVSEKVGTFATQSIMQYKVFSLISGVVHYELWRMNGNQLGIFQELTATGFTEIPLVPFYANKIGDMASHPPYMNVANNNINTFQLSSQKQRALKIIGDPDKAIFDDAILQAIQSAQDDDGGVKATSLTFGADIAQVFSTDARYTYVEPTGKGVELIGGEVARIETFMDGLGAEITDRSNMSATEAEISNTKATAADVIFSKSLEGALNKAYEITTQIDSSLPKNETMFVLDKSFARMDLSDQTITVLNTAVMSGNLSKETFLKALGRGELPKFRTDESIDAEIEIINAEQAGI